MSQLNKCIINYLIFNNTYIIILIGDFMQILYSPVKIFIWLLSFIRDTTEI